MEGKKIVGVIGYGNMGEAICRQLKSGCHVIVFDKDESRFEHISGLSLAHDSADLVNDSDIIIIAVKPQNFDALLKEIKPFAVIDKLFISIAAGITTEYIEKILGQARIIRAMPNIAAKVGAGVTCLSRGKFAAFADLDLAEDLFEYLGECLIIEEEMMNAATAVSGSGPGFFFYLLQQKKIETDDLSSVKRFAKDEFIPQLNKAAQGLGFKAREAEFLTKTTANSCISLLMKSGLTPLELQAQVTSKGGTTAAGLEVLSQGMPLADAVRQAMKRAEELSRRE